MYDLRQLTLTRNQIREVDPATFTDLYSLVTLSLSDNELTGLGQPFRIKTSARRAAQMLIGS